MKKPEYLKDILEDYGLAVSVKERKYVPNKAVYWFEVKLYDESKDEAYRSETQFKEKRWLVYDFLNTRYSIITNMSIAHLMDLKITMDELSYTRPTSFVPTSSSYH